MPIRSATLLLLGLVLLTNPAVAQQPARQPAAPPRSGFILKEFRDAEGTHKYSVFVPKGYSPQYKWPLILFLHGAGERGTDGVLPTTVGIGPLVKAREDGAFPFIVVFPQAEDTHGQILTAWSPDSDDGKRALEIVAQVEKDYSVDTKREMLVGWSMGGYGAFDMAAAFPERWLSVVTVSGGGKGVAVEKLKDVPLSVYHGAKDKIVRPEKSREIVEAIKQAGGNPRYSEVADGDHNVWKQVFDDDKLYSWMLYPKADPAKARVVTSRPKNAAGQPVAGIPEPPFIPALEIPRVAYVRLGNEALAAFADSIPKLAQREALVGRLSDISDYTSAEGYTFSVYMSGLSYSAQLARANVKAYRKDRLNIQLGLSNAVVTIGGTSISGESHSATAGPMSVVIGHQRPVWLSFDVVPTVVDRKLQLKHVATAFQIPNDNWYVTGPAGVSTHGFGLTREKVSSGLVSGIYSRKGTIEQKVVSVIPNLIAELEKKIDLSSAERLVSGIWPLPVYEPRLRIWPAEISTDEQGVSLVLGATAAAVDPAHVPKKVHVSQAPGIPVAQVPTTTKLQVGMAPKALGPLSELLVDADAAHIHVADTPSDKLARLADPAEVSEIIPDLKRYGDRLQVQTELVLAGPINVVDQPTATADVRPAAAVGDGAAAKSDPPPTATDKKGAATGRLTFEVPKVKLAMSIKTGPEQKKWTPLAEFTLTLRQQVIPEFVQPSWTTRGLAIDWTGTPQVDVEGGFVEAYQPNEREIDLDRLKSVFSGGWEEFVEGGSPAQVDLPDLDLGYTKLRANDAGWAAPNLYAVFGTPSLRIANDTDKPLVYETKGPYSDWGGPYTLKPGAHHDFAIAYPLLFRRRTETGYQMFTLPVGSNIEYRPPTTGSGPAALFQAREKPPAPKPGDDKSGEEKTGDKAEASR